LPLPLAPARIAIQTSTAMRIIQTGPKLVSKKKAASVRGSRSPSKPSLINISERATQTRPLARAR
jgi:hypothetical protein